MIFLHNNKLIYLYLISKYEVFLNLIMLEKNLNNFEYKKVVTLLFIPDYFTILIGSLLCVMVFENYFHFFFSRNYVGCFYFNYCYVCNEWF